MSGAVSVLVLGAGVFAAVLLVRVLATRALHTDPMCYSLQFPAGLDELAVGRFVVGVASLLPPMWRRLVTQPVVAFEVSATAEGVSHRLLVPRSVQGAVEAHLIAHVPSVRWDIVDDAPPSVDVAVEYRTTSDVRPLRCDPAGLSASLLASLQPLSSGESVSVQWLLAAGATVRPPRVADRDGERVPPSRDEEVFEDGEAVGAARSKYRDLLVLAVGRIGVRAATSDRSVSLLRQMETPLNSQRSLGVSMKRRVLPRRTVARRMTARAIPTSAFPARLNIEEASGVICWPIGLDALPGLDLGGCPLLPVPSAIAETGTLLGLATFPSMKGRRVAIDEEARKRGLSITGPTGSGKSNLMASILGADMAVRGRAVVLIDVKGDTAKLAARMVPEDRIDDVVYLDGAPSDTQNAVGYNPLASRGLSPELVAEQVLAVMRGIYTDGWGARSDELARGVLYSLTQHGGMTLCEFAPMLTNKAFRHRVLAKVDDPYGVGEFWETFESWSERERNQAISPILNKARALTQRGQLRAVIGQAGGVDFNRVLNDKRILLADLSSGRLGSEAANLMAAWLFTGLFNAIVTRSELPEAERPLVAVHFEEFAALNALPLPAEEVLATVRGYGCAVTLATQGLSLLDRALSSAVRVNCRSKVVLAPAHEDAVLFAREFGHGLTPENLMALPAWEAVVTAYAQGAVRPPTTIRTLPVRPLRDSPDEVIARSRQRWGVPRADVEAAIGKRRGPKAPGRRGSSTVGQRRRSQA